MQGRRHRSRVQNPKISHIKNVTSGPVLRHHATRCYSTTLQGYSRVAFPTSNSSLVRSNYTMRGCQPRAFHSVRECGKACRFIVIWSEWKWLNGLQAPLTDFLSFYAGACVPCQRDLATGNIDTSSKMYRIQSKWREKTKISRVNIGKSRSVEPKYSYKEGHRKWGNYVTWHKWLTELWPGK